MGMIYHKKRSWAKLKEETETGMENTDSVYLSSQELESGEKHYEEQPKNFEYTKTDINRMSTSQLQKLASESGIENANEKSGGELKKILIEKFSL